MPPNGKGSTRADHVLKLFDQVAWQMTEPRAPCCRLLGDMDKDMDGGISYEEFTEFFRGKAMTEVVNEYKDKVCGHETQKRKKHGYTFIYICINSARFSK